VPSVPFDRVRAYVEAELNTSIEAVFSTFSRQPLAGASLGQVRRPLHAY
jgi:predicted unusual protein kinase regulating ubiquinone biosynthesis (AarF/ABC1/UbiB family)